MTWLFVIVTFLFRIYIELVCNPCMHGGCSYCKSRFTIRQIECKQKSEQIDFRGVQIVAKNNFYALPIDFYRSEWAKKTFLTMFENYGNIEKNNLSKDKIKDFEKLSNLCRLEFEKESKKCQIESKEKSL